MQYSELIEMRVKGFSCRGKKFEKSTVKYLQKCSSNANLHLNTIQRRKKNEMQIVASKAS